MQRRGEPTLLYSDFIPASCFFKRPRSPAAVDPGPPRHEPATSCPNLARKRVYGCGLQIPEADSNLREQCGWMGVEGHRGEGTTRQGSVCCVGRMRGRRELEPKTAIGRSSVEFEG